MVCEVFLSFVNCSLLAVDGNVALLGVDRSWDDSCVGNVVDDVRGSRCVNCLRNYLNKDIVQVTHLTVSELEELSISIKNSLSLSLELGLGDQVLDLDFGLVFRRNVFIAHLVVSSLKGLNVGGGSHKLEVEHSESGCLLRLLGSEESDDSVDNLNVNDFVLNVSGQQNLLCVFNDDLIFSELSPEQVFESLEAVFCYVDLRVSDKIINMVDSFYSKALDLVFSLEETSVDCLESVVEFDNGLSVLHGFVVEVVEQKQVELGRYLIQNHDHEFSLSNVD